jgi:phage shock protein PspC (stress-responsive transcriptional regulator)
MESGGDEMGQKRIARSRTERMLGGVCGGLAEYFDVDPTMVRLAFAVATMFSGMGCLVYLAMWLIVPEASAEKPVTPQAQPQQHEPAEEEQAA